MFNKIIFYNYFNNGDIHVSKSLVNWVINNIPAGSFEYQQKNGPYILSDLPVIQSKEIEIQDKSNAGFFVEDNNLYFNTWYLSYDGKFKDTGMTIQTLFSVFKETLNNIGEDIIGSPLDHLPQLFYKKDYKYIIDTIKEEGKKIILIANCECKSRQTKKTVDTIIKETFEMYGDSIYILTNDCPIKKDNVYFISTLINKEWNTLLDISSISIYCDILVGSSSGPHTYTLIKENLLDINKTIISHVDFSEHDFGIRDLTDIHAEFIQCK